MTANIGGTGALVTILGFPIVGAIAGFFVGGSKHRILGVVAGGVLGEGALMAYSKYKALPTSQPAITDATRISSDNTILKAWATATGQSASVAAFQVWKNAQPGALVGRTDGVLDDQTDAGIQGWGVRNRIPGTIGLSGALPPKTVA